MAGQLDGKRVLVLGAETDMGRAVTTAVAEAGAKVAAVAATSEAEAAFAVQRLARRLSSGGQKVIAQAIDATNEAALRVMVRQVSKELGGLDAVVYCKRPLPPVVSASQVEEGLDDRERVLQRGVP
ncbi:MAG: SDR family NAD(P)-dependent oxidoreductase [Chloroflexi bacterium]|nr:MAG: SDR family NAD(P)-dependent oxidoreductase [Chloroflexota bacterium]